VTTALTRLWSEIWQRLRGVRGRLVATYLLAASLLCLAGVALFTFALGQGLRANVDTGLQNRATATAADLGNVAAGGPSDNLGPVPAVGPGREGTDIQSFTAVYTPAGWLVDARPATLPQAPITAAQSHQPPAADTVRTTQYAGESFRVLISPIARADGVWQVVVGQNMSTVDDANSQVRRALTITVPLLLALLGIGAWLLSGAALRPVQRMTADAQALSEHDTAGRISEPATRDSLNQLARTFNALLDRLHGSLDRQRSLVADAGHELRTPLAVLQTELETALRPNRTRADLVDSINHARIEVDRLATLAEDLLLLAQADGGQPLIRHQLSDVGELLDELASAHQSRAQTAAVALNVIVPTALIADLDPIALRRILDNVLANALRHTPPGGTITIRADLLKRPARGDDQVSSLSAGGQVRIRVSDTGPGFPPEFIPHAFERFGRADQGRSRSAGTAGSGLGLSIVQALVQAHSGSVTVSNVLAGGGQVEILIPVGAAELMDDAP
jgi:two-component system OmpR family sensor kinase